MNPRVFVSHATEDKDRFVVDFATRLRARGVDTWLDQWEMLPGDSLVQKIFEEGIKNAQAFIVVLSKYSINKSWVREELDAGIVKRVNTGSKLIPVIIDLEADKVPEALKATLWVRIDNFENCDKQLDQIVAAIYGRRDKTPLGKPPAYTQSLVDLLPGLTREDSHIMKLACEKAIELGHPYLDTALLLTDIDLLGIPRDHFLETLEIIDRRGYIKATRVIGNDIPFFVITDRGFENYAKAYINDYDQIVHGVIAEIVNLDRTDSRPIAVSLNQPHMIVVHVLNTLDTRGLLRIVREAGLNTVHFYNVSPELKRMLSS